MFGGEDPYILVSLNTTNLEKISSIILPIASMALTIKHEPIHTTCHAQNYLIQTVIKPLQSHDK